MDQPDFLRFDESGDSPKLVEVRTSCLFCNHMFISNNFEGLHMSICEHMNLHHPEIPSGNFGLDFKIQ